jgi:predicted phosphodiesterase
VADSSYLVGLISDTHGLMRQDALDALRGSDLIIHAGDIGDPAVLESLAGLAPIRAIRGNNDKGSWAAQLPKTEIVEFGPHSIYVLHDLAELDLDPAAAASPRWSPATLTSQSSRNAELFSLSIQAAPVHVVSACR